MVYRAATVQGRGMLPPQTWKKTWQRGETVRWKDDLCSTNTPCVRSAGKWASRLFLAGGVVLGRVRAAGVEGKRRRDVLTVLCKPTAVGAAILCLSHVRKKARPGHLWELCAVWKWHSNTGLINRASHWTAGSKALNKCCTLAGADPPLFMSVAAWCCLIEAPGLLNSFHSIGFLARLFHCRRTCDETMKCLCYATRVNIMLEPWQLQKPSWIKGLKETAAPNISQAWRGCREERVSIISQTSLCVLRSFSMLSHR